MTGEVERASFTLAGRWVLPVSGPPIPDGLIAIRDGVIAEVGPRAGRVADVDLGPVAITPGFVNAHTHLDLEPIAGERFDRPRDQVAWLSRVVAARREAFAGGRNLQGVVRANLKAAIAAGTTALADIAGGPASLDLLASARLRGVVCAEVIGLRDERARATWEAARAIVARGSGTSRMRVGLSPHAPYSAAAWLYREAARCGIEGSGRPIVATHLAELPAELELLESREGPLRGFLESIGAWDDAWRPAGPSPLDGLSPGPRWLVAHGTYLDLDDLERRAADGLDVAVVYCPRTTAWFGHGPHPYRRLLASEHVSLAIGTDSLASTPSLSVLDELRFLRRLDAALEPATLLRLGTIAGARALDIDAVCGTIEPGKSADLAAIALPAGDGDPIAALLDADTEVVATVFEGRFSYRPDRRWMGR